jgi:Flp pilus assembly protein TadG
MRSKRFQTMRSERCQSRYLARKGNIVVLAVVMIAILCGFCAFAIDCGLLTLARTEAQNAADASALAAGSKLVEGLKSDKLRKNISSFHNSVLEEAILFAKLNKLNGSQAQIISQEDVVIGTLKDPSNPSAGVVSADILVSNALQVTIRANRSRNNAVRFFFAPVLGTEQGDSEARAVVKFASRLGGVKTSSTTPISLLIPFVFEMANWRYQVDLGYGGDSWSYDESTGLVTTGADGVPEFTFYPVGSGSGNWGTIDIGDGGNSSTDLERQILEGVNETDLTEFSGAFTIDPNVGYLNVNGDTGIDANLDAPLKAIIGQPRIIPLFDSFTGTGNNVYYRVVGFAGIRVMDVCLQGGNKYVIAQPASIEHASVVYSSNSTSDLTAEKLRLVD